METAKFENNTEQSTLILHIGGPKCGSSALQTFLTRNPRLETRDGTQVEYWKVAHDENSNVTFLPVSETKPTRGLSYQVSSHFGRRLESDCLHKIFESFILENSQNKKKIFVFSCEGWAPEFQTSKLANCNCIQRNFKIQIYQNVRPQVNLLISTYLQWALWTENPTLQKTFSNYLTNISDWEVQAENALKLGADKILVRYTSEIVADFCEITDINHASVITPLIKKVNKSLSLEAIILLLRNRELRPGPHDAHIDFLLEDLIDLGDIPITPISIKIENDLIEEINEHFRVNNMKLLLRMTQDHARAFEYDLNASKDRYKDGIEASELLTTKLSVEFLEKLLVFVLLDIQKNPLPTDAAIAERNAAIAERNMILSSNSWKLLSPYRQLTQFLRQGRGR
jgi:hypothetical protein